MSFFFIFFFICLIDNFNFSFSRMSDEKQWNLYSWKNKEIVQNVVYKDEKKYNSIMEKLEVLPPLVHQQEVKNN